MVFICVIISAIRLILFEDFFVFCSEVSCFNLFYFVSSNYSH